MAQRISQSFQRHGAVFAGVGVVDQLGVERQLDELELAELQSDFAHWGVESPWCVEAAVVTMRLLQDAVGVVQRSFRALGLGQLQTVRRHGGGQAVDGFGLLHHGAQTLVDLVPASGKSSFTLDAELAQFGV